MTLPTSGPISLADIQQEFGGTHPVTLSNYYKGGAYVHPWSTAPNVPASGKISISDFYGASNTAAPAVTWVTSASQSMEQTVPFSLQLNATNAVTYAVTSGTLPNNLSMTTGGLITGTPGTVQTTYPTITATSIYNVSTPQAFTFDVYSPPPSYNEIITGPASGNGGTQLNMQITGAAPNSTYNVTQTSGPPLFVSPSVNNNIGSDGTAIFVVLPQQPAYYNFSFYFTATGDTRTFSYVVNYTYTNGFTQEYGWTGSNLTLAQQINQTYYESNNAFTVTYTPTPETRWGLYRRGESGGISFWVQACVNNGWSISSQGLINAIFTAASQDADAARALTPNKSYVPGPGYGDFSDRPVP